MESYGLLPLSHLLKREIKVKRKSQWIIGELVKIDSTHLHITPTSPKINPILILIDGIETIVFSPNIDFY